VIILNDAFNVSMIVVIGVVVLNNAFNVSTPAVFKTIGVIVLNDTFNVSTPDVLDVLTDIKTKIIQQNGKRHK
jgi:hypothetical protein